MKIVLTETEKFFSCMQTHCPSWRNKIIKEIENQLQENLKTYLPFGYNSFLFNRELSTIYIQKIEVKTIEDVFNTDIYGLLND